MGHFLGHYLSATAMAFEGTGREDVKARGARPGVPRSRVLLSLATGQGVPRAPRPRVLLSLANPRYAFRLVGLLIDVIFPTGKQDSSPW